MKLKTSFFNFTVLKKDLLRFSPFWGLILAVSLLVFGVTTLITVLAAPIAAEFKVTLLPIRQIAFGWTAAVLLFGDIMNPRAAGTLHALPMRREGWFLTHTVAGVLFFLLAISIPRTLTAIAMMEYWYLEALVLLIEFCVFLFFFGLGVFSVQCSGTRLGSLAVYTTLNFFTALLLFLFRTFYEPQLYGIRLNRDALLKLCPVVSLTQRQFLQINYNYETIANYTIQSIQPVSADWWYLAAVVAAGLVFFVLALLLYRRRHIESAGNFVSLRTVGFVFLILLTLVSGALWFRIGSNSYVTLTLGLALGFFPVLMLLEKRVRVFRGGAWLAYGILTLGLFSTLFIVRMDPMNVVRYVPDPSSVTKATLSFDYDSSATPTEGNFIDSGELIVLDTPEELALLQSFHQTLTVKPEEEPESSGEPPLAITYHLKNGRQVRRIYNFPQEAVAQSQAYQLMSLLDPFQDTSVLHDVVSIEYISYYTSTKTELQILAQPLNPGSFDPMATTKHLSETRLDEDPVSLGLWEAVRKDCLSGNMTQTYSAHSRIAGRLDITRLKEDGSTECLSIYLYPDSKHTLDFLEAQYNII